MKLRRATLLGISGLDDVSFDLVDPSTGAPRRVALVTGPSGSGKTRLLEAILAAKEIVAPYGAPVQGGAWCRDDAAKAELGFELDEDEQRACGGLGPEVEIEALFEDEACQFDADEAFVALLERYEHGTKRGKFDYFPASRAIPPSALAMGFSSAEMQLLRASSSPRKYGFVPRYLASLASDPAGARRFSEALAALTSTIRFEPAADDPVDCFVTRRNARVGVTQLSTSEANAVIFAASAALVHYERSIVLVDRPEQGVPERSIVAWMEQLSRVLGDAQLVVATDSPALIAAHGATLTLGV
jgi:hypothetical protein